MPSWKQDDRLALESARGHVASGQSENIERKSVSTQMTSRREKLEAMLADDPNDQTLRYMLAMELEKESDHNRSLDLLQRLMDDESPYVPAFLMAGQQLARLQRTDEAANVYRSGIQQAQQNGDDHAAGEMSQFLAELG